MRSERRRRRASIYELGSGHPVGEAFAGDLTASASAIGQLAEAPPRWPPQVEVAVGACLDHVAAHLSSEAARGCPVLVSAVQTMASDARSLIGGPEGPSQPSPDLQQAQL